MYKAGITSFTEIKSTSSLAGRALDLKTGGCEFGSRAAQPNIY